MSDSMKSIISDVRHSADVDKYTKEQRQFLWSIADRLEAARESEGGQALGLRHALQRVEPLSFNNFDELLGEMQRNGITCAPQPDKWIPCSDKMPNLGQRVILKSQGVVQHFMPTLDEGEEGPFWDFEQDYNPEVNFGWDCWMPVPAPPEQESE